MGVYNKPGIKQKTTVRSSKKTKLCRQHQQFDMKLDD